MFNYEVYVEKTVVEKYEIQAENLSSACTAVEDMLKNEKRFEIVKVRKVRIPTLEGATRWELFPSSGLIERARYWPQLEHLEIIFNSSPDTIYCYKDVPEQTFNRLTEAESAGGFYHKAIKGLFECEKITIE